MATTIVTKSGSGAPTASDLVAGELAVDLTNKRLYTEDSGGTVLEVGSNPYNFTANHDGSAKLATTATGIDVTGSVTADGLTVDGQADFESGASLGSGLNVNRSGHPSYGIVTGGNTEVYHAVKPNGGSWQTYMKVTDGGDISFYEDTGTTPKFFWDASAESLGIGVSNPLTKLHLDSPITNAQSANSSRSYKLLEGYGYTVGGNYYGQYAIGTSYNSAANTGTLEFFTGSGSSAPTERMRIDSSGNVNINGTDNRPLAITSFATASAGAGWDLDATSSNGVVTVSTGGTEAMRIDASGNLLLNRSSAFSTAKMEIQSDAGDAATLALNSINTDGSILSLYKAGTAVGSIKSISGTDLSVESGGGVLYLGGNSGDAIRAINGLGSGQPRLDVTDDATTDLGASSSRFKDLYLSGTAYTGDLLVGKTAALFSDNGVALSATGLDANGWNSFVTATPNASGGVQALNRKSSDGIIQGFYKDGTLVGSLNSSVGDLAIGVGDCGIRFNDAANAVIPFNITTNDQVDNNLDLGYPTLRWNDAYITNGVTTGSDGNDKQDIETLSDAEQRVAVACKGLLRKWRWKDAVEAKGDDARIHFGIIAQDLQAAFEAEGLDAGRYAMFMSNTWADEETGEERTRLGIRYHELLAFIVAAI